MMLSDAQIKTLKEAVAVVLEKNNSARVAIIVAAEADVQRVFASLAERMLGLATTTIANVNRSALTLTVKRAGETVDPSVRVVRPEGSVVGAKFDHVFHDPSVSTSSEWFVRSIKGRMTSKSTLEPFPAPAPAAA